MNFLTKKLGNAGLIAAAICILGAASAFGQNAIPVDTQEVANYGIRDAKLVSTWVPKVDEQSNAEIKVKQTQLVFSSPNAVLNFNVILTAFGADGTTLGQSVWCARTVNANLSSTSSQYAGNRSSNAALFALEVNPTLWNAAKYSMSIMPPVSNLEPGPGPETCAECANTATAVCGTRGIKSMTCGGTAGTCTFVCRD
ncbi:MAG: hypothetical protein UZ17_ACD001001432 [Acidobacteria bacterium OLB17]|nr:MAG: hypothetical protein UZ17_ACD001001432 [Acidobacteria bacterium OLB17]MCZ2391417.1 hypothetical protein [Acidobacteriota bacterium]